MAGSKMRAHGLMDRMLPIHTYMGEVEVQYPYSTPLRSIAKNFNDHFVFGIFEKFLSVSYPFSHARPTSPWNKIYLNLKYHSLPFNFGKNSTSKPSSTLTNSTGTRFLFGPTFGLCYNTQLWHRLIQKIVLCKDDNRLRQFASNARVSKKHKAKKEENKQQQRLTSDNHVAFSIPLRCVYTEAFGLSNLCRC